MSGKGSNYWVRPDHGRWKWHRVRIMSIYEPHFTTYCGLHPNGTAEGYADENYSLPNGITCVRCR
jgi:hypothetical protein